VGTINPLKVEVDVWVHHIWLVVSTPLKNINHLGLLFPIYGKIRTVPNHQPDIVGNNDITMDTHANPQPQWLLDLTSALLRLWAWCLLLGCKAGLMYRKGVHKFKHT